MILFIAGVQMRGKETRKLDSMWLKFKIMPVAIKCPECKKINTKQGVFFPFWGQANIQNPGTFLLPSLGSLNSPGGLFSSGGQQPSLLKQLWLPLASSQWMIAQITKTTATAGNSADSPQERPKGWKSHRDYVSLLELGGPEIKPRAIPVT